MLPQYHKRWVANPRVIRDETNYTPPRSFSNSALSKPKEANIELIQIEFFDAPFLYQTSLINLNEVLFFTLSNAGIRVVWGIAKYNENWFVTLNDLSCVALRF